MKYLKFFAFSKLNKKIIFKNIGSAFDNVLAVLPAIILMPITINSALQIELFNIPTIIFMSGVGTLVFLTFTKGKIPCSLGSSFVFISATISMYNKISLHTKNLNEIHTYIIIEYILSGFLLIILFLILKLISKILNKTPEKTKLLIPNNILKILVPASVLGPAISLIGLELSGQAIEQTYLNKPFNHFKYQQLLSLITIGLLIIISLWKRKFLQNTSIAFAVVLTLIIRKIFLVLNTNPNIDLSSWEIPSTQNIKFWSIPINSIPNFNTISLSSFKEIILPCLPIMILPTILLICEHTARRIMIDNLSYKNTNNINNQKTLCINGISNVLSSYFYGVPLTLYAESIAVMRINKNKNILQFVISSIILIVISFMNKIIYLISNIPQPIIGSVSLVLMGIIAVPGLKVLVDEQVDYDKLSNLFLSASVLLVGLSNMSLTIKDTEISGMGLGLLVGMILNIIILILQKLKLIKDEFSYLEIYEMCKKYQNIFIKIINENNNEFMTNKNTYAFLKTGKHGKIEFYLITTSENYEQYKKLGYTALRGVNYKNNCIKYLVNVDKISDESKLNEMIKNSYLLCNNNYKYPEIDNNSVSYII